MLLKGLIERLLISIYFFIWSGLNSVFDEKKVSRIESRKKILSEAPFTKDLHFVATTKKNGCN